MHILVTGGAGFIGCNFVRHILNDFKITVIDKLSYGGRLENLNGIRDKIEFVKADICDRSKIKEYVRNCDIIVNFAAESHVDRSIFLPEDFIKTNFYGVFVLLELARKYDIKVIHISTDEVYGSIKEGSFDECSRLNPSSPYSASKASADLLCMAYYKTYSLPVIITRSSNNYGPYQMPEKFIPKTIIFGINNRKIPVYGDGTNVRDWVYVKDNCEAIALVMDKGKSGQIYNIASGNEKQNLDVVKLILELLQKDNSLIEFVKDRPGHDKRYSIKREKILELGWKPKVGFIEGLKKTISWYKDNEWWWKPLLKKVNYHELF